MSDLETNKADKPSSLSMVECIGTIYESSENCGLHPLFFQEIETEVAQLAEYFHITNIQAFIFANVISLNFNGSSVGTRDLIDHFACNPIKIVEYTIEMEKLQQIGLLKKYRKRRNHIAESVYSYAVAEEVIESIKKGESIKTFSSNSNPDIYEILEWVGKLWDKVDDDEMMVEDATLEIETIVNSHIEMPVIQSIKRYELSSQNTFLLLFLIWRKLLSVDSVSLDRIVDGIVDKGAAKIRYIRSFHNEQNQLIEKDLVEISGADFSNNNETKLTDKTLEMLERCGLKLISNRKKRSGIINPENIIAKKLIYNNEELKQLSLLKNLLDESNLNATQAKLIQKGLPQGITVLLYGAPGCGKTESVFQIAKHTGRQIMKVDISSSKSSFFGESEKQIKKIFTAYREYSKEAEKCPILLFNEADAIFSKRKDSDSSGVAPTENAIQNILLEEMENFDGILICTTNLLSNFDPAFNRRFLFKVKFQKPSTTAKAEIWRLKLPNLKDVEYEMLATQFDFSGGQIDNISRKAEIHEVLYGSEVNYNQIIDFCSAETMGMSKVKIGFAS